MAPSTSAASPASATVNATITPSIRISSRRGSAAGAEATTSRTAPAARIETKDAPAIESTTLSVRKRASDGRARRAERAPDGDLSLPAVGAHEEQIADVRAGHQHHDAHRREHDPERAFDAANDRFLEAPARENQTGLDVAGGTRIVRIRTRHRGDEAHQLGPGIVRRHAVAQAGDAVEVPQPETIGGPICSTLHASTRASGNATVAGITPMISVRTPSRINDRPMRSRLAP